MQRFRQQVLARSALPPARGMEEFFTPPPDPKKPIPSAGEVTVSLHISRCSSFTFLISLLLSFFASFGVLRSSVEDE